MKRLVTDLSKLEKPAEPLKFATDIGIEKEEGLSIISEIKKVMESKNLIALSAPQIGINKRIFCIKFDDTVKTFINPIITKKSGLSILPETFANLPGKEILIGRPQEVTVVYHTDEFKYEDNKLMGAAAQVFDQMCQALDGVLPTELGLVSDVEEDGSLSDCTEEEMKELIEMYKKFIATKQEAAKNSISEEDSDTYRQLKFSEDVINGRTQIIANDECKPQNRAQRRAAEKVAKKIEKKMEEKK